MNLKERIEDIVKNPPIRKLKEPITHWDDDGKSAVVIHTEIDYAQAAADILKAFVDHCGDFYGKEDVDRFPQRGEVYNQAIKDITKDMITEKAEEEKK